MYQPNNGRRLHYATKSEAARLGFRHGGRARQEVRAPLGGEHAAGPQAQEQDLHGTYREACNELAKIQATRCDERAMPTVGQLYEARYLPWLERKYEGSESSTPNSYKRAWDSVCARRWADVPIDQIKPLEVQGWLDGMAYGNAHWALVVMRRTLDFAVNLDQIPANPFRRKYEMPRKSSEHQKNVYTLRQAEAMLSRVEGLPYEAAYILAAFGGCRTGESLAVRVEDVREIEAGGVRAHEERPERPRGDNPGALLRCALARARSTRRRRPQMALHDGREPDGESRSRGDVENARQNTVREPAQLVAHLRAVRVGRRIRYPRIAHGAQASRRDGAALSVPVHRAASRGFRRGVRRKTSALGINWDMKTRNPRSEHYTLQHLVAQNTRQLGQHCFDESRKDF